MPLFRNRLGDWFVKLPNHYKAMYTAQALLCIFLIKGAKRQTQRRLEEEQRALNQQQQE
jgi:hypothetical protein